MKFGPVPLSQAAGAILAHSLTLPEGRLRKGCVLGDAEIAQLEQAGFSDVIAARLEPGDIGEDAAATRLAQALVPDAARAGLHLGQAATGRVNITATTPGVVEVLPDRIHALNAVDPMITVATVPEYQRTAARSMVATVKIISYAVSESALEAACHAGQSALRLRPVTKATARLIQTVISPDDTGDKGQKVTAGRLSRMGVTLDAPCLVPHQISALTHAIQDSPQDIILILTGSATSDPHDVAPEALLQAGGQVTHYGMPVDPGNLLFFGSYQGRPVLGLPGCARSPALNGADWVLERMLCDVPVTPADIARMGVGGLLKEIPLRGRLREA
jgi:molybdenum cofactor cytidylyltransferase